MSLDDELMAYQRNAWPAMVADLAGDLGVSAQSLVDLGIGWMPAEACWVFPERDAEGRVVGLSRRFKDGKKLSTKGSKRGLTYVVSEEWEIGAKGADYTPGPHNWVKVEAAGVECPICHKGDWCLVSAEDPNDPKAVICGRVAEGASQPLGDAGYLHIRKAEGNVSSAGVSPLQMSSLPLLVVEGQSDTAAAATLGFVGVGKPSASGGLPALGNLLIGREVVVIGENDAGAGRLGMEKTYEALKPKVKKVTKLMPPEGVKDLRSWLRAGLDQATLLEAIRVAGETTSSSDLLESTAPMDIADRWLRDRHSIGDLPILRMYSGNWFRFDGKKYTKVEDKTFVRGDLYQFLKGKTGKVIGSKGEVSVRPYDADAHKVNDILDTLTMICPVYKSAPCWLDGDEHPRTEDAIGFNNGLLFLPDLNMTPASPQFFSMTAMPYDWNRMSRCDRWLKFLEEVFPGDPQEAALLQEWFGYNLVADTSQEKLMFLIGRPGAGKGTVLEAMRAMLGSGQVASTSFDSLVSDFGLQPLLGKLAAIMPDAHITKRGDPAKALQVLKEISGRDSVGINRKNKEFLSDHKLSCRFTISVNSMPDLPDHERSLDRRLLLLHFGESFAGREDTSLKDTIAKEAAGIAVWAVEGLLRLRSQGWTEPESAKPVIEEFRKQSSPVSEFADEFCVMDKTADVPSLMVYDAYVHWCKDQGAYAGTHTRFSQRFLLLHPGVRADRILWQGKRVRGFIGVKLTEEATERYLLGRR